VRRFAAIAAVVIAATACTPQQVQSFADDIGFHLEPGDAEAIAEWTETQDCLPEYGFGQYVECAVSDAARSHGIDQARFARLVWCESRFDPDARNRYSSATGLAQFLTGTWDWVAELGAPHADEDRTHGRANAFTAAWLIARTDLGGWSHWNASRGCWS
jgi:soluble lytic murein transglycosylase-like protein